ncbi:MAG: branched-chain amino acid ABC transporter permease [Elainellaceae cyanobacterium]
MRPMRLAIPPALTRDSLRRLPWQAVLVVLAILLPPLVVTSPYAMHLLVLSAIYTLLASSLNLVMGYSGLLSLGHHAFFGIGAYTSVLLSLELSVPLWLSIPLGGVAAAIAGWLLSTLLLKLRSAYFVISTIAFAEIMRLIATNWESLTQGPMGITGVPVLTQNLPLLSAWNWSLAQQSYLIVAVVCAVAVLFISRLVHSDVGRSLMGMREAENLAESLGINTRIYALISVVVGTFFAGIAGGLYGHYTQFLSPDVFYFILMVSIIIMVLGGGMGTVLGPVLGGLLFTLLPELLRSSDQYRMLIYGVIIILFARFAPMGLWANLRHQIARLSQ